MINKCSVWLQQKLSQSVISNLLQDFRYPINVVMTGEIDFSDPATQLRIEQMMQTFENSTYIKPSLTTR